MRPASRAPLVLLAALATAWASSSSCASRVIGSSCVSSDDCPGGSTCTQGSCVASEGEGEGVSGEGEGVSGEGEGVSSEGEGVSSEGEGEGALVGEGEGEGEGANTCGNGVVDGNDECDGADRGCSLQCTVESGFQCVVLQSTGASFCMNTFPTFPALGGAALSSLQQDIASGAREAPVDVDCNVNVIVDTSAQAPSSICSVVPLVFAQQGGPDLLVYAARDWNLGGSITFTGNRVPVFVAFGAFTLTATIDVGANGATPGPGGDVACGTGSPVPPLHQNADGGVGGGGAGSAANTGGAGGRSKSGCNSATGGVAGSTVVGRAVLAGGCHGAGGTTSAPNDCDDNFGGPGGAGGGAVAFWIAGAASLTGGVVVASGGGAGGGIATCDGGGGGGGGSGGVIDVEVVGATQSVVANLNGGGGGGGGQDGGHDGHPGGDGRVSTSGGDGGDDHAGKGGNGGAAGAAGTAGANQTSCGSGDGGGGGAGGLIISHAL